MFNNFPQMTSRAATVMKPLPIPLSGGGVSLPGASTKRYCLISPDTGFVAFEGSTLVDVTLSATFSFELGCRILRAGFPSALTIGLRSISGQILTLQYNKDLKQFTFYHYPDAFYFNYELPSEEYIVLGVSIEQLTSPDKITLTLFINGEEKYTNTFTISVSPGHITSYNYLGFGVAGDIRLGRFYNGVKDLAQSFTDAAIDAMPLTESYYTDYCELEFIAGDNTTYLALTNYPSTVFINSKVPYVQIYNGVDSSFTTEERQTSNGNYPGSYAVYEYALDTSAFPYDTFTLDTKYLEASEDYTFVARWEDSLGKIQRRKLWDASSVIIFDKECTLYSGEILNSSLVFEIWASSNIQSFTSNAISIPTSIRFFPRQFDRYASNVSLIGTSALYCAFDWTFPIVFNQENT